jgi:hypothetical protein
MTFWASKDNAPKRNYRFLMSIGGMDGKNTEWLIKKTDKPRATVGEAQHQYLNHTFYYPGRVTWEPLSVTLVDPVSPNAAGLLANMLRNHGYDVPTQGDTTSVSKEKSVAAMGEIKITQIDADGQPTEEWTLRNAFIKDINWGTLDYESDDLTNLELTLRYDYATLKTAAAGDAAVSENTPSNRGDANSVTNYDGVNAFFKP